MMKLLAVSVIGAAAGAAIGALIFLWYLGRSWDATLQIVVIALIGSSIGMAWLAGFRESIGGFYRAYKRDENEIAFSEKVRTLAKTILELIRNLGVVAALKFVAVKADSSILTWVAEIGILAVAASVSTYFTTYRFDGFDDLENPRLRGVLNFVYTLVPGFVAYYLLSIGIRRVVDEIVKSQGLLH